MAKVFVYNDSATVGFHCPIFKMPTPVSIYCEPRRVTCLNLGQSEKETSTNIAFTVATRINSHSKCQEIMAASYHDEDLFYRCAPPPIVKDYELLLRAEIKKALASIPIRDMPTVWTWDRDFIVRIREGMRSKIHHLMVKSMREHRQDLNDPDMKILITGEEFATLARSIGNSILGCWISLQRSVRRCECMFLSPLPMNDPVDMVRFYYRKGEIKSRKVSDEDVLQRTRVFLV